MAKFPAEPKVSRDLKELRRRAEDKHQKGQLTNCSTPAHNNIFLTRVAVYFGQSKAPVSSARLIYLKGVGDCLAWKSHE